MPANMVIYNFFLQICLEESSLCDSLSPIVFAHNDANTPNMVMTMAIIVMVTMIVMTTIMPTNIVTMVILRISEAGHILHNLILQLNTQC